MPRYTWESIRRDSGEREALFRSVEALEKGVEATQAELNEVVGEMQDLRRYRPRRVASILERMKRLAASPEREKNPDFEDCLANLDNVMERIRTDQPEKYAALTALEGFRDLEESTIAARPRENTAGEVEVVIQESIYGFNPDASLDDSATGATNVCNYLALNQLTRGVEDWRSLPYDREKHLELLNRLTGLMTGLSSGFELSGRDGKLRELISAPGRNEEADALAYLALVRGAEPQSKSLVRHFRGTWKSAKPSDILQRPEEVAELLTNRILARMPKEGGSFIEASERAYRSLECCKQLAPAFMSALPPDGLSALAEPLRQGGGGRLPQIREGAGPAPCRAGPGPVPHGEGADRGVPGASEAGEGRGGKETVPGPDYRGAAGGGRQAGEYVRRRQEAERQPGPGGV